MRLRILDPAEQDLLDGYAVYESQAEGIGQYFLDSLYSDIESLIVYAGIHRRVFEGFHCMFSKRFPYAIHYTIEDSVVLGNAVFDCRQNPQQIRKRLGRGTNRLESPPDIDD